MAQSDEKSVLAEDVKVLHSMGYAQELSRRMHAFSNFAISFSIICILSGGINSLGQATAGAGGIAIGLGWPVGVLISGVFALALAQISSAYPTAGGLYHWGSILGNRFTGWLSAWLNLLGLITVLGAINVGTFYFFFGAFGPQFGIEDTLTHRVLFVAAITALQALVNHFGIGLTMKLTDFSGYIILFGSVALAVVCLMFAETWEFGRLFTWSNYTGTEGASAVWPNAVSGMAWRFSSVFCCRSTRSPATTPRLIRRGDRERLDVGAEGHGGVGALVGCVRIPVPVRLRAHDPEHGRGGQTGLERFLLGNG